MRILHTANTYAPLLDGVAEVVRNISERLAQRGHEVHVATSGLPLGRSYAEARGVHVHRFSVRGNLALGMYGEIEKYREFVGTGSWDILVNHGLHVWPTDALVKQIGSYTWSSVLVTHGIVDEHPSFLEYYSTIPQHLLNYSKWIRVSSCSGEAAYSKAFNLPVPPVITNGVDMDDWARPPLGLRRKWGVGQRPWVVNVSNHSPLKGHDVFFRLADSLRDLGAYFTLVAGSYPMAKWGLGRLGISGGCAYQCKLRSIKSPDTVDLRVNRPREEVISAIREADMMVSTSKKEANSLALLESMAAGVPWVSFDVGSARENSGGVVVRNVDEMGRVVSELARSPELRRSLGDAGRAQIMAKHSWDGIVDQYEQLYESAVGQRSAVSCQI
ncbi:MAG: glycosyltransferase family 4 protein [Candidatus Acidiferrum sp.]